MKTKALAFIPAIILVLSLVSCGEPSDSSSSSVSSTITSKQSSVSAISGTIYEIGQTGSAQFGTDKFEITVTGAAKEYSDNDLKPGTGFKYMVVPIKVKNASAQDTTFSLSGSLNIMYADKGLAAISYAGEASLGAGVKVFTSSEMKAGETVEGSILIYVREEKIDGMLLCYKAKFDGTALLKFKLK